MSLEDIEKRWEKVEQEMPFLVAPTKYEIQQHKDIEKLLAVAKAAKVGAFHHSACQWLYGEECGCAKQYVDEALAALEQKDA